MKLWQYTQDTVQAMGDAYVKGVVSDYPWASLEGQTIIDIGGGQATLSLQLAKAFPNLRFIIQDLPEALILAKPNIETQMPGALEEGRFTLEPQDFFKEQARKGDSYIYMFRHVLSVIPPIYLLLELTSVADTIGRSKMVLRSSRISLRRPVLRYGSISRRS